MGSLLQPHFTERQTEARITEATCQGSWEHGDRFPQGPALRLFLTSTQPIGQLSTVDTDQVPSVLWEAQNTDRQPQRPLGFLRHIIATWDPSSHPPGHSLLSAFVSPRLPRRLPS